ncbi:MAG TPA: ABC transporter transmembrane domain-containing protein, partial [Mucilaginibacter sp.]|nr:ABC transporter transmembrane domain-containing protein [Mucilaginibacter sp.]
MPDKKAPPPEKKPGISSLLKPYKGLLFALILFALFSNSVNLWLPKIIGHGIDDYGRSVFMKTHFDIDPTLIKFSAAIIFIFIFSYLQSIIQTYASEKVARDLRTRLSFKISQQSSVAIDALNPSKLLTNLTADVDSIKLFVSQALVSIVSSVFIILGVSVLLLTINWRLGLCIIAIIPIIGITFAVVLKKVRVLFKQRFAVYDWLNKVISESILGSALIRVINSQQLEFDKFLKANTQARDLGLGIIRLFSGLIPVITFTANIATLAILALGGHFVIANTMSLGDFAAFN